MKMVNGDEVKFNFSNKKKKGVRKLVSVEFPSASSNSSIKFNGDFTCTIYDDENKMGVSCNMDFLKSVVKILGKEDLRYLDTINPKIPTREEARSIMEKHIAKGGDNV